MKFTKKHFYLIAGLVLLVALLWLLKCKNCKKQSVDSQVGIFENPNSQSIDKELDKNQGNKL